MTDRQSVGWSLAAICLETILLAAAVVLVDAVSNNDMCCTTLFFFSTQLRLAIGVVSHEYKKSLEVQQLSAALASAYNIHILRAGEFSLVVGKFSGNEMWKK